MDAAQALRTIHDIELRLAFAGLDLDAVLSGRGEEGDAARPALTRDPGDRARRPRQRRHAGRRGRAG